MVACPQCGRPVRMARDGLRILERCGQFWVIHRCVPTDALGASR